MISTDERVLLPKTATQNALVSAGKRKSMHGDGRSRAHRANTHATPMAGTNLKTLSSTTSPVTWHVESPTQPTPHLFISLGQGGVLQTPDKHRGIQHGNNATRRMTYAPQKHKSWRDTAGANKPRQSGLQQQRKGRTLGHDAGHHRRTKLEDTLSVRKPGNRQVHCGISHIGSGRA